MLTLKWFRSRSRVGCVIESVLTLFAIVVSITGGLGRADAGAIQLSNPSQLGATDSTFTDPDNAGTTDGVSATTYAGPSVSFTTTGNLLTWSRGSGPYETDQADTNYLQTAFPSGTQILYAGGFSGNGDGGPVTLIFANPVNDFGVNVEEFAGGPYTVAFTVYDGTTALGTFSAAGCDPLGSCSPSSGVLSFEGAAATGGDAITRVVFDDSGAGGPNNLGFGPVTYGDASATPEPGTFWGLGLGLLGVAAFARRRISVK